MLDPKEVARRLQPMSSGYVCSELHITWPTYQKLKNADTTIKLELYIRACDWLESLEAVESE